MVSYNVTITMHDGTTFTVGTWTCKKSEAVQAAKASYPGNKSYKAVRA